MTTPEPDPQVQNVVHSSGTVYQVGVVRGDMHVHLPPEPVTPRQLPAARGVFAGRSAEMAALDEAGSTVVVSAIGGAGGIGKTWLVVQWANARLESFPDGQLFVDLRGFSPASDPMTPAEAVRGFLDALGVTPDRLPRDLDAQAALYRSLVADRRMLIVLDNAATAGQITPLLPGGSTCTVVVTSRKVLTGLITRHGAQHLNLDVLADAEARALLENRLGAPRLTAEADAAEQLLAWCRGFPLALSILAGRAQTDPALPLARLVADLRRSGIDALDDEDPTASLSAVLATSYQALSSAQREVFGLLGIAPGPDNGLPAAASLVGQSEERTEQLLRALVEASLLQRSADERYSMHDVIREFAANAATRGTDDVDPLPDDLRNAALERVLDFYLHTANAAARIFNPHDTPIPLEPPTRPHPLPDVSSALAWMDAEHSHLLAAQQTAATRQKHLAVWQFAWSLANFHHRRGHRHDDVSVWQAATAAAAQLPDADALVLAHRNLGSSYSGVGRHEEGIGHLYQALAMGQQLEDRSQEARTHHTLAWAWDEAGDNHKAFEHAQLAVDCYRALGNPVWVADALNSVGWCAAHLGQYEAAREYCTEALALHKEHSYPDGEADNLDSLGFIEHQVGNHQLAVAYYQQALSMWQDLSNTTGAADTYDNLGHSHAALGEWNQAAAMWRNALELYRQQGREAKSDAVQQQLDELSPGTAG